MITTQAALNTAVKTWRRTSANPAQASIYSAHADRRVRYEYLWAWYDGTVFRNPSMAAALKQDDRLYRQTRLIYNQFTRLADFWGGVIYPGKLSRDGQPFKNNRQTAIPFADDTPPTLASAIAQLWQWENWQAGKDISSLYAAITGNCLEEIIDDVQRGKVYTNIVWPSLVRDVTLNSSGDVVAYSLEFEVQGKDDRYPYTYRKEVDKQTYRFFRDDEPWDYVNNAKNGPYSAYDNPYGFVPAVWRKHIDAGSTWGITCIGSTLDKLLELNSYISHVHDQVHKVIGAPIVLWADGGSLTNLLASVTKRGATSDLELPEADREGLLMLQGPANGRVDHLSGNLQLDQAKLWADMLLTEIDRDHPELTFRDKLSGMERVSGVAAAQLLGPEGNIITKVTAGHDVQTIKRCQMQVAIAGHRATTGGWGSLSKLTEQQRKFLPFGLDSYQQDKLSFEIEDRPLVPDAPLSATEKANILTIKKSYGVPLEELWKEDGYTASQITKWTADKQQAAQDAIAAMQAAPGPGANPQGAQGQQQPTQLQQSNQQAGK